MVLLTVYVSNSVSKSLTTTFEEVTAELYVPEAWAAEAEGLT